MIRAERISLKISKIEMNFLKGGMGHDQKDIED